MSLCPHLRTLIEQCTPLAADAAVALGQCHDLEQLVLDRGVTDEALTAIAHGCPRLQVLRISHYSYYDGLHAITDQSVVALSEHCGLLHTLSLQNCMLLTDAALCALATGCPLLETISLDNCDNITGAGLVALHHGSANLRKITISSYATRAIIQQQKGVLTPVLDVIGGWYVEKAVELKYGHDEYDIDAWNDRQKDYRRGGGGSDWDYDDWMD